MFSSNQIQIKQYILTGLPRSGKSFFTPLLSEYFCKNTVLIDYSLDTLIWHLKTGGLSETSFTHQFSYTLNLRQYDMLSGRNVNLRVDEDSSVFKSDVCKSIIQNAFTKEPLEKIYINHNVGGLVLLHSSVSVAKLILDALNQAYIFNVFSDPSLLVYSWFKSGYGKLCTYEKQGVAVPLINFRGKRLPIYAYRHEKEFLELDEIGRICLMLSKLSRADVAGYEALSEELKTRVMLLDYSKFLVSKDMQTSLMGTLFDGTYFNTVTDQTDLLKDHASRNQLYDVAKGFCDKNLKNNKYYLAMQKDYRKLREILDGS